MELANERIATKKTGETAREDANALQKAVIERQKYLIGLTEPEEKRLIALRDKWDEAEEAEKAAKLAAEKARVDAIRAKIADTQAIPAMLVGKSSQIIAAAIDVLEKAQITLETHQEFSGEAEVAKLATIQKLWEMFAAQQAHEQAAAEAARQAEADRVERERVAEENRIEAKRLADLAAEIERKAQAERAAAAERERIAEAARREQEAKDRAERERIEAQQRAEREAEQRKLDDQRREFEREQAEFAAKQQALREATEKLAREQREREEAEAKRIADEARAKREAEESAAHADAQRIASVAAAEAERREREAAAEVERAALAAEVARLHALQLSNDGLGMLEDVLQEIARPIGVECCGKPDFDMGYVCCGNAEAAYHTMDSLSTELNKWRNEIIERRVEQKEAA
ncbi:MAG TPA: hypothetical protein VF534_17865 [Paraburkholderia sp.]